MLKFQTVQSTALKANLAAMRHFNEEAATRVDAASAHPQFNPLIADDGTPTGELLVPGGAQALSSRRRPLDEAKQIAERVDLNSAAVVVVIGFGAGHHVREVARRVGGTGLVLVFEPDVSLLNAVFSNIDHSAWIGSSNVRFLTDPEDRAAMSEALRGCEGLVGMGLHILEHAPSKNRLSEAGKTFAKRLTEVIESTKMTVLTSLVQVRTTIRNSTQNLDRYVQSPGVAEIAGACKGRAAIVVSAGPSLARNIDILSRPGLRDRFVIIAVQTVIKPLLEKGIRPHFVTALDHSEISRRFYEGLTSVDVQGITLVAEPKVNPAVLEAWPGAVRTTSDPTLDRILGDLSAPKGTLTPGATVAHLAYYLARYLGCDPVALIGQDLGFTDGQYYAPGASIHQVWGGELNEFNTLEMLEWQRIMRMGPHLRRSTDVLGREVFTDEQMQAYLAQFERDFKRDAAAGLTTFDATEGGVRKQHTQCTTLDEFVRRHWDRDAINLDSLQHANFRPPALSKVDARVRDVRQKVWRVQDLCKKAESLLTELIEHHTDQIRVNRLIGRLDAVTAEVVSLGPAYALTHTLAQTGAFNRVRADRLIHLDHTLDAMQRQRRQGERDLANVRTLGDTAKDLGDLLDRAIATLGGGERMTRELLHAGNAVPIAARTGTQTPVVALVPVIERLRAPRELSPLDESGGECSLVRTLRRAASSTRLSSLVVATDCPEDVNHVLAASGLAERIRVMPIGSTPVSIFRSRQMWAARAAAMDCWRGGIAGASVWDEGFDPTMMLDILTQTGATACAVIGPTWELVDPALLDQVVERFQDDPEGHRMTFTQAVPGLSPCVLERGLLEQLAKAARAGVQASIGALLGYSQQAPVNDLIASSRCVHVPTDVRDAGLRIIADSRPRREWMRRVLASQPSASALQIVHTLRSASFGPSELVLDARLNHARAELASFAESEHARLVTIVASDLTSEPGAVLPALIRDCKSRGLCAHVRTSLPSDELRDLLARESPEIVSVDLYADDPHSYFRITGRTDFSERLQRLTDLLSLRATADHPTGPLLVVPRMTRCDAAYSDMETFFHRWLHQAGWAVIDPLAHTIPGERIAPLPLPAHARDRLSRSRRIVLAKDLTQ